MDVHHIKKALAKRLVEKGLDGNNISGFISMLFRYLKAYPDSGIDMLNRYLDISGFPNMEMDYHTYQLVVAYYEFKNKTHVNVAQPAM